MVVQSGMWEGPWCRDPRGTTKAAPTLKSVSDPALTRCFRQAGAFSQQRGQISVHYRHAADPRQIHGRLQTRENSSSNLAPRHLFFAISGADIARPEADVFHPQTGFFAEINGRMPMFFSANLMRPEDLDEIAGLRFIKADEVATKAKLMK